MILIVLFFFAFIFPLFFMGMEAYYSSPIMAVILFLIGLALWIRAHLIIVKAIMKPKKVQKEMDYLAYAGIPRQAKVIKSRVVGTSDGLPQVEAILEFENLANNKIRTIVTTFDSKPHEKRFEKGATINIRLNPTSKGQIFTYDGTPPQVVGGYKAIYIYLIFNILYSIGLFLGSYYLIGNGYGLRFLHVFHPWLWAPIINAFINKVLLGELYSGQFMKIPYNVLHPDLEKGYNLNELILHGKIGLAEVIDYQRTGYYVNDQPQLRFMLTIKDQGANMQPLTFKRIVGLEELHKLKKGEVEIFYVPGRTNLFALGNDLTEIA